MKNLALALILLSTKTLFGLPIPLVFDKNIDEADVKIVSEDLDGLEKLQISEEKESVFDLIFKGTDSKAVVTYLGERLHFMIKPVDDAQSLISLVDRPADPVTPVVPPNNDTEPTDNGASHVGASNVSFLLWILEIANEVQNQDKIAGFKLNNDLFGIGSPRVGVFQMGPAYKRQDSLGRMSILVHEARHSDCTGGLDLKDLQSIFQGKDLASRKCSHGHILCPKGHPLEGLPACDDHAWGAYSIGAFYSSAQSRVKGLTQEQIQIAKITAMDSLSRVMVAQDMLDGKLGLPDMSSSGEINIPKEEPPVPPQPESVANNN